MSTTAITIHRASPSFHIDGIKELAQGLQQANRGDRLMGVSLGTGNKSVNVHFGSPGSGVMARLNRLMPDRQASRLAAMHVVTQTIRAAHVHPLLAGAEYEDVRKQLFDAMALIHFRAKRGKDVKAGELLDLLNGVSARMEESRVKEEALANVRKTSAEELVREQSAAQAARQGLGDETREAQEAWRNCLDLRMSPSGSVQCVFDDLPVAFNEVKMAMQEHGLRTTDASAVSAIVEQVRPGLGQVPLCAASVKAMLAVEHVLEMLPDAASKDEQDTSIRKALSHVEAYARIAPGVSTLGIGSFELLTSQYVQMSSRIVMVSKVMLQHAQARAALAAQVQAENLQDVPAEQSKQQEKLAHADMMLKMSAEEYQGVISIFVDRCLQFESLYQSLAALDIVPDQFREPISDIGDAFGALARVMLQPDGAVTRLYALATFIQDDPISGAKFVESFMPKAADAAPAPGRAPEGPPAPTDQPPPLPLEALPPVPTRRPPPLPRAAVPAPVDQPPPLPEVAASVVGQVDSPNRARTERFKQRAKARLHMKPLLARRSRLPGLQDGPINPGTRAQREAEAQRIREQLNIAGVKFRQPEL